MLENIAEEKDVKVSKIVFEYLGLGVSLHVLNKNREEIGDILGKVFDEASSLDQILQVVKEKNVR